MRTAECWSRSALRIREPTTAWWTPPHGRWPSCPGCVGQTFSSNARPLAAGGFLVHQFVDFNRPRSLVRHLPDGTLDLSFGQAGKLDPQWYPPGDCSRVRLQEAGDGGMSVLFDQGKDSTRSDLWRRLFTTCWQEGLRSCQRHPASLSRLSRSEIDPAMWWRIWGGMVLACWQNLGLKTHSSADGTRTTAHSVHGFRSL